MLNFLSIYLYSILITSLISFFLFCNIYDFDQQIKITFMKQKLTYPTQYQSSQMLDHPISIL
jgi:hypothetical protein